MTLRGRFRLLLAIFGVAIVANMLVSVWCIHIYVGEATGRFEGLLLALKTTDHARRLLDELSVDLAQRPDRNVRDMRYRVLADSLSRVVASLPESVGSSEAADGRERLKQLAGELSVACDSYVQLVDAHDLEGAGILLSERIEKECVEPMQQLLVAAGHDHNDGLAQTATATGSNQMWVTTILTINAGLAFLLAAAGVHLVRNWVLKPVGELMVAAERHAKGDLDYRIGHIPRDELGTLSREINRMADSLAEIQGRLVERERMAAIGEVASTVAHNIRNPLAGIRASAQSSMADLPDDGDVAQHQMTIVKTVDSLNRWLRELLQVSQPIQLACQPTLLRDLVDRVTDVLSASAARRHIVFEVDSGEEDVIAEIDAPRLEQAVLTIVENAIDASSTGGPVRIEIAYTSDRDSAEIRVIDKGVGVPPEVMEKIASAYFSTKPGGTGIGLYLAKRVVRAHGGTLTVENNPDRGTKVTVRVPRRGHTMGMTS